MVSILAALASLPALGCVGAAAELPLDGEPSMTPSALLPRSKFSERNGDVGKVVASQIGGEGDKLRDSEGVGEPQDPGEVGDIAWESDVSWRSLSSALCPSSLCLPFCIGGGEGLDRVAPLDNKVL